MRSVLRSCAASAVAFTLLGAASASASTLLESSLPGGDFSGDWTNFTFVDQGVTTISGTWSGSNDYDFIAFTGLATGAQTITLTFTPIAPLLDSFSGGGTVMWKDSALKWSAWEGSTLGAINLVAGSMDPQTLVLSLGASFAGTLFLQLYGTNSSPVAYNISAPGNAAEAAVPIGAVPLPAAAPLMVAGLAGLAGLGALRRRRRG